MTGEAIFASIQKRFKTASPPTKALILTAYVKLINLFPSLMSPVQAVFTSCSSSMDTEVQQRATEFAVLAKLPDAIVKEALAIMPPYQRASVLDKNLRKLRKGAADRDLWMDDEKDEPEPEETGEEPEVSTPASATSDEGKVTSSGGGAPGGIPGLDFLAEALAGPTTTPATTASTTATSSAPVVDLFGLGLGDTSATASSSPSSTALSFPSQPQSLLTDALKGVSTTLYQASGLFIAAKTMMEEGHTAKMIIVVRNDTPSTSFDNVTFSVDDSLAQAIRSEVKVNSVAQIAPGQSDRFPVKWTALRPFEGCPQVIFNFTAGGQQHSIKLQVPLLISTFCTPREVEGSKLLDVCTRLTSVYRHKMSLPVYTSPDAVKAVAGAVGKAFGLAIINGVDSENNVHFAGQFVTATKNAEGNPVTIATVIRIETRPGFSMIRVTVNAAHQLVANAMGKAVQIAFAGTLAE